MHEQPHHYATPEVHDLGAVADMTSQMAGSAGGVIDPPQQDPITGIKEVDDVIREPINNIPPVRPGGLLP